MENEKKQVVIEVRDKIARLADETLKLVCGNSDYEVIFDFDGDWGVDTEKTAYFVYNYDTVPVIFKGNKVDGVAIHMASLLSIGVSEGDIKTTTPAEIPMLECITDRVGKCINIPESLYNQLMVHINELYNKSGKMEDAVIALAERVKELEFSPEDAGKFLIVGEDGKIAVSPVSVGSPIVVTDAATMDAILVNATEADIGKVYLYQGETTANYENGALYGIEAV